MTAAADSANVNAMIADEHLDNGFFILCSPGPLQRGCRTYTDEGRLKASAHHSRNARSGSNVKCHALQRQTLLTDQERSRLEMPAVCGPRNDAPSE